MKTQREEAGKDTGQVDPKAMAAPAKHGTTPAMMIDPTKTRLGEDEDLFKGN